MSGMADGGDRPQGTMGAAAFARIVRGCWSDRTATTYSDSSPARGQCSVTSILAQECLGGVIAKTAVDGLWHFYNIIDGQRFDFTEDQFDDAPRYDDVASDRQEALADTTAVQREALASAFCETYDRLR